MLSFDQVVQGGFDPNVIRANQLKSNLASAAGHASNLQYNPAITSTGVDTSKVFNPTDLTNDTNRLNDYNDIINERQGNPGNTKIYADQNASGYSGTLGDLITARNQLGQTLDTERNQNTAGRAAGEKYLGDVGDFQNKYVPRAQESMEGGLIARGQQASMGEGGIATKRNALFNDEMGQTLGNMADSYNEYQGNLGLQSQARANAMQKFFNDQAFYDQQNKNAQPGLFDFLSPVVGTIGAIASKK